LQYELRRKRDWAFNSQYAKKNAKEKEQNGEGRFAYSPENSVNNQSKPKSPNLGVRAGGG